LVASHVGIKMMGLAMGLISAGHAIGGALGAFLGGYIFSATGTYDLVWTGSIWLAVMAGLLVLFLKSHPAAMTPTYSSS
jgi:predicted MFS family arabinose efflux permease